MTWKSNALVTLVLFLMASTSFAEVNVTGVTTKRIGSDFFIELNFSGAIADKDVRLSYGIDGIDIYVNGASSIKRHIKTVKDTSVERVATSNAGGNSMRLQIEVSKNLSGQQFEKTTSYVAQTNQLLIRVGDPISATAAPTDAATASPGDQIDKLMGQEAGKDSPEPTSSAVSAAVKQRPALRAEADEATPVFKNPQSEVKEKGISTTGLIGRMLLSLLVVSVIFGGGLYGLKKWPGAKKLTSRHKMIEILAQHSLGPKKSVAVIRVAGEAVLVGITDTHVSILKTLSLLDEEKFQSALQTTVAKNATAPPEDEFSMRGLKEIVNDRLKNMRSMN